MALCNFERETHILYDQEGSFASMETMDGKMIRRMDRLCEEYPDTFEKVYERECEGTKECGYRFPKRYVKVSVPRVMTEEQKEAAAERLRSLIL